MQTWLFNENFLTLSGKYSPFLRMGREEVGKGGGFPPSASQWASRSRLLNCWFASFSGILRLLIWSFHHGLSGTRRVACVSFAIVCKSREHENKMWGQSKIATKLMVMATINNLRIQKKITLTQVSKCWRTDFDWEEDSNDLINLVKLIFPLWSKISNRRFASGVSSIPAIANRDCAITIGIMYHLRTLERINCTKQNTMTKIPISTHPKIVAWQSSHV